MAIIILTLVIKLVLSPLTAKQIRSMEGMQTLQPKIKELQQKYKGNQKKLQEEMAKLYKQTGVILNGNMRMLYWQKDWKTGEATYHQELEAVSQALLESAEPTAALTSLDLAAIQTRLVNSPAY